MLVYLINLKNQVANLGSNNLTPDLPEMRLFQKSSDSSSPFLLQENKILKTKRKDDEVRE